MKLRQLKIFDCAARYLNVSTAARELGMSQPAVSLQLKRLEQEFGAKFYRTSNRGMKLTSSGRAFLDSVRPILADLDRIDVRFKAPAGSRQSNILTVGGNHTLSVTVLLEVLKNFRHSHSDTRIAMETDSSTAIERRVADSQIEVGLINSPHHHPTCTYEVFMEQETLAFVPAESPIPENVKSLEGLSKHPLVARKGSAFVKELIRRGYVPNIAMELVAPDAVKAAVQRGLGVGLLLRARVAPDIEKGEFKAIDVPELQGLTQKSFIVYQRLKPLSPIAQEFIQALRDTRAASVGSSAPVN